MKRSQMCLGVAAATLFVLGACSSEAGSESAEPAPSSATAVISSAAPATPSATPAARGLREICPEVEAALPQDLLPDYPTIMAFDDTLSDLYDGGDLEAQNALVLLTDPTGALRTQIQYASKGQPLVTALRQFETGVSAFADRCAAAGSSALQ